MQEYYFISSEGQQVGPVSGEQLLNYGISPKTLVWGQNMSGWATADSVPEIVALFTSQQQGGQRVQQNATSQQSEPQMVVTPEAAQETIAEYPAIEDTATPGKEPRKHSSAWFWVVIALLAIGAGVLGYLYFDTNKRLKNEKSINSTLRSEAYDMEEIINDLDNFKNNIGNTYPIIITDIDLANVHQNGEIETDYGSTIYDYCSMFLKPKITYTGLKSGTIELKLKWINSDGSVRSGNSSPSGYTLSQDCEISSGSDNVMELNGWGNETMGHWRSGRYRLEIWYDDVCLKAKTFRVY